MTNLQEQARTWADRMRQIEVGLPDIWAKVRMNKVIAPAIKAYTEKWLRA